MKLKEFFTGTQPEKVAQTTVDELSGTDSLNKKNRNRLEEAKKTAGQLTIRRRLTAIAAAIAITGGAGAIAVKKTDKQAETSEDKNQITKINSPVLLDLSKRPLQGQTPEQRMTTLMSFQQEWQKTAESALEHFTDADPKVQKLLSFMGTFAHYPIPQGPQTTIYTSKELTDFESIKDEKSFEIVFMPPEYATQMTSPIITEPGGKTMRVATTFKSKEWLGIMLAHEMSHVYDQLIEGENPHNPTEYLAGEVKAHLFEMKLLKHWNPKNYETLITEGSKALKDGNRARVIQIAQSLYPIGNEVSSSEGELGLASCLVAIGFETAMAQGATEKDLQKVYQGLRNF